MSYHLYIANTYPTYAKAASKDDVHIVRRAMFAQDMGNPKEAVRLLKKIVDQPPLHPFLHALMAHALYNATITEVDGLESAIAYLNRAIELDRFEGENRGLLYCMRADFVHGRNDDLEIQSLLLANNCLSKSPDLMKRYAATCMEYNHIEKAAWMLNDYHVKFPIDLGVHLALAWVYQHTDRDRMRRHLDTVREIDPEHNGLCLFDLPPDEPNIYGVLHFLKP